jgi:CRISPR-associated endonuclease/helicase Cas3
LTLPDILVAWGMSRGGATDVAQALGGHHGSWPSTSDLRRHRLMLGNSTWTQARVAVAEQVRAALPPATLPARLGQDDAERDAVLLYLSGLCSVADWVASGAPGADAAAQLAALGWSPRPAVASATFDALYGFPPHALQTAVLDTAPTGPGPHLVIIEAPTGTGKTEMAFTLADRWGAPVYIAMPTQATSNQMWTRFGQFLQHRYPSSRIAYHLTHSGARHTQPLGDLPIGARSWFLPAKRGLLAQYAVGTIDQALMAALQVRHQFVRAFGLARRTVICDEVHAYDAYMNELFIRLLTHLRALQSKAT